jgi:hypothetical protein
MALQPDKAEGILEEIDREYEGRHTDTRFVRLLEQQRGQPVR